jgi:hypothetical protein
MLREKLRALQEKRQGTNGTWTAEDQKTAMELRKQLARFQRRPLNPAIAETVALQVTLATTAEPGDREVRLGTPRALSNPLVFCVGQLPEVRKPEPREEDDTRPFVQLRNNNEQKAVPATEMRLSLPVTINGQIMPGGVDRYRFYGYKGRSLVAIVSARALIPYLADAVPGWVQPTLALYDTKHKELAYQDDYRFRPDPVLHYEIPADGEYTLEIKDAIYRGREDFVYRIAVGELPFVTGLYPLGGKAGEVTQVELSGWNLPMTNLLRTNGETGICFVRVTSAERISNRLPFAVDTLPESFEQEPNDNPASAQMVTLPLIINGRISQPGDSDVFKFQGRAGEEVVAEVYARRLDSPLDSVLRLTDGQGHQLAFNDDCEDKGAGLDTHYADSCLRARLPADGVYYVHLADAQHHGGPEYAYRLRISAPRPDFALRIVPSSITARVGMSTPVTLYVLRRDGFTNDITLTLKDAPAGFSLSGGTIPGDKDQAQVSITAPLFPLSTPATLAIEGSARVNGIELVRPAVPADDLMQAFAYHHLVPAQELRVAVPGRGIPGPQGRFRAAAK